ncbi:MAG: Asp-tRNA(Asn)/Glu-tRNA(Gln) amidotransferase subunit GatC [Mycoplasmoidaceae bacterium]
MSIKNKYNSKEKIIKYSKNLLINLTDEEIKILIKELDEVFEGFLDFYNIDDKNLEPTNYIFGNIKSLRKDEPIISDKKDKILKCSKTFDGKYIKV